MQALNLHYVTMTSYDDTFKGIQVVFNKDNLAITLGEVLETAGKTQIRTRNGEISSRYLLFLWRAELPLTVKTEFLCPSPNVATYDLSRK